MVFSMLSSDRILALLGVRNLVDHLWAHMECITDC